MDLHVFFIPTNDVLEGDVLHGEYRTIASGENFKGLVNARLVDPDKLANFPNSNLRGFASFAGSDGTVMECVMRLLGQAAMVEVGVWIIEGISMSCHFEGAAFRRHKPRASETRRKAQE